MEKFSTSSHKSRPLLFLSLVVSLVLYVGGFYPHIMAGELPIHEMAVAPQLESIKLPVIITDRATIPELPYLVYDRASFAIAPFSPPLIANSLTAPSDSPFTGKKWINFSRGIARESIRGLAPLLLLQNSSVPDISSPGLEERAEKHDFVKEMFSSPINAEELPTTATVPFNISALAQNSARLEREEAPLLAPRKESCQKHSFDSDAYNFAIDDPLPSTAPLVFHKVPSSEQPLSDSPRAAPKEHLKATQSTATDYFSSLESLDLSDLNADSNRAEISPRVEEKLKSSLPESSSFALTHEIPSSKSPSFLFQESELSVATAPMGREKLPPSKRALQSEIEGRAPSLNSMKREAAPIELSYPPRKELFSMPSTKEKLFNAPSLKVAAHSEPSPFTYLESAPLFQLQESNHFRKEATPFTGSAIALHTPRISTEVFKMRRPAPPSPTKETLRLRFQIEPPHAPVNAPPGTVPAFAALSLSNELQMMTQSLEFHHMLPSSRSHLDLALEREPYLPSLSMEEYPSSSFHPTEEAVSPHLKEDLFVVEMATPKRTPSSFELSKGSLSVPLRQQPASFQKQMPLASRSPLAIKSEDRLTRQIESGEIEPHWPPTVEEQSTPLAVKTLPSPPLSDGSNNPPPPLDTRERVAPQLKYRESREKLAHAKRSNRELQELPLSMPMLKDRELLALDVKVPLPQREVEQTPIMQPITKPRLALHRLEFPILALEAEREHPLKIQQFDLSKKRLLRDSAALKNFSLPYFKTESISPSKQQTLPKEAFEGFSSPESIIAMLPKTVNYPNTRSLIEKNPAPSTIRNAPALSLSEERVELKAPSLDGVHSHAEEIVAEYNQANRSSAEPIALANPKLETAPDSAELSTLNQSYRFTQAHLSEIPEPSALKTISLHNEFETEVQVAPRRDGKGYYFALKMKPNERLYFESPEQNVIFVIDGSSSIKKHRFNAYKDGVLRALPYLKKGDTFNILVADAQIKSMQSSSIPSGRGAVAHARRFLSSRSYRGFFTDYDSFDLLEQVTPYLDSKMKNVIVLITDGHSLGTIKYHKEDLQRLAAASHGNFSVFTASASRENNLTMLDLVSTFNDGELMHSQTKASFPRKLAILIKHIGNFVAKEIHIQVASRGRESGVEFYPNEETLPSLYSDRPYMVYGSVRELKDFDLIMQGRNGDQWVNIREHISFKDAERATYAMRRSVALQQAYSCYDTYLQKDDTSFLAEAERFLAPHSIPSPLR
ncbi:MAG: hypothetical protein K1060chlam2_00028 [Chlamydiae bacterium]|nr:hypothetical protein [Chlamydiota bacterium]